MKNQLSKIAFKGTYDREVMSGLLSWAEGCLQALRILKGGKITACIAKRRGRYVIDFHDNPGRRRWKTLPKVTTKEKGQRGKERD